MSDLFYRPEWVCGKYVPTKHAALYYNLLTGMCYDFTEISADVVGEMLSRPRNASFKLEVISEKTGIDLSLISEFANTLMQVGLITNQEITAKGVMAYRQAIRDYKRSQPVQASTVRDKLPFERQNAEQDFINLVGGVSSVMFELTYNCSEKCIHCYNIGATRNDEEISHRNIDNELQLDDYKRIIDEFHEAGLFRVCITGGDPFSKPIVWDLIDYLYKKEIIFDVYTNGQRLFGYEEKLASYYPRLVAVSIYSNIEEDHDFITRIPGSLRRSRNVMRKLSELAVPMNLKCCIMRPNVKSYSTVLDFASEVGAVPQFEISISDSIEGDLCASQFLRLKPDEMAVVLRDSNIPLYVGKEAPDYGRVQRDLNVNACGAGDNTYCVTPDGKLIPCCAFHLEFGDLHKNSVQDILSNSENHRFWNNLTLQEYEECGKYEYCNYCNLCPGNNYSSNKDPRKASENNCYIAKIRCEVAENLRQGIDILHGKSVQERLNDFSIEKTKLHRYFIK